MGQNGHPGRPGLRGEIFAGGPAGFSRDRTNTEHLFGGRQYSKSLAYADKSPWPDADGNGYYLKLAGLSLDNSLPESWIASSDLITSVEEPAAVINFNLYPNPARNVLNIEAETDISSITIYDYRGSRLLFLRCESNRCVIDVGSLAPGIYIARIFTAGGSRAETFIKE